MGKKRFGGNENNLTFFVLTKTTDAQFYKIWNNIVPISIHLILPAT